MSKRVLVIGATGLLGTAVSHRLLEDGFIVRVLTRSRVKAEQCFDERFEIAVADVEDRQALAAALEGCHAVHVSLPSGADGGLEGRGMAAVVASVPETLERISFISGPSVCEDNAWFWMIKGKWEAQQILLSSGLPYTILRPTYVMDTLALYLQGDRARTFGSSDVRWHWVCTQDLARAVSRALSTPEAEGTDLTLLGPEALTVREALERYCAVVAPQARVSTMPLWLLSLVGLFKPPARKAVEIVRYLDTHCDEGDPGEADALLGASELTVEAWAALDRAPHRAALPGA